MRREVFERRTTDNPAVPEQEMTVAVEIQGRLEWVPSKEHKDGGYLAITSKGVYWEIVQYLNKFRGRKVSFQIRDIGSLTEPK